MSATQAVTGERTTVSQKLLWGVETTKGTAVTATKKMQALGLTVTPDPTFTTFKPAGGKYITVSALQRELVTASLSGYPTYTELAYLFSSLLTAPVITAGSGTTGADSGSRVMDAAATHWFFKPVTSDVDSPNSFTVAQGSLVRAHRFAYGTVTDLAITGNRNDSSMSGTMMGDALVDDIHLPGNEVQTISITATGGTFTLTYSSQTTGAIAYNADADAMLAALEALSTINAGTIRVDRTVAASPDFAWTVEFGGSLGETNVSAITGTGTNLTGGSTTVTVTETTAGAANTALTLKPILPGHVCIYAFDSAQADISDTTNETAANQLLRVHEWEYNMGGRYAPYFVVNCNDTGIQAMVESDPTTQLRLRFQANQQGMAYLTLMRTAGTKYIRIKATGDALGTDAYECTIDFAGIISDAGPLEDHDGVYGWEITLDATPSLTNGTAHEVVLVNNVTAL